MCAQTIALHNRDKQIAQEKNMSVQGAGLHLNSISQQQTLMLSPKIPVSNWLSSRASYLDNEEMAVVIMILVSRLSETNINPEIV